MRLSEVRKIITNMHTVLTYLHNLSKIPSLEPHITSLYTDFPKLAAIYTSEMVVVKEDDMEFSRCCRSASAG